ncbi:MAG: potassium channel protein, partial [Desulfobacteraceae bacterium]|nr:potassium channel protein [Desulfobacteraceae bacterium]
WSFMDALYQTVITISTVGFSEIHPITHGGRIMTIVVILLSITVLAYFFSQFVTIMVEGRINKLLRGRKMEKRIKMLKDHFIICGFGRMGRQVCYEFLQSGVPFVVLDKDPEIFEKNNTDDILWITGDATREEALTNCRIDRAKGLVSVLSRDEKNVYVVLTARGLNPGVRIVTRAIEYESERKMKRAGADFVVSPFKIGGSRIASVMLRPSITHFMDGLARAEEIRLTLVELEVVKNSFLEGKTIKETGILDISESIIIGLRRMDTPMKIRPKMDTTLKPGDQIVLMGQLEAINRLELLHAFKA